MAIDRRIFVQSDIGALIALRDTDKPLDDAAKDLVYQQKERLERSNETEIAIPDTYENLPLDLNQLKEILVFLVNELADAREMNAQLTNDVLQLKTKVSRLQQDHHGISSAKNAKIEKSPDIFTGSWKKINIQMHSASKNRKLLILSISTHNL